MRASGGMRVENDKFVKSLPVFYVYAAILLIFGLAGICLGLYVMYIRGATPGELILNRVLTLFSLGMASSAIVHFSAFNSIKKLKNRTSS